MNNKEADRLSIVLELAKSVNVTTYTDKTIKMEASARDCTNRELDLIQALVLHHDYQFV